MYPSSSQVFTNFHLTSFDESRGGCAASGHIYCDDCLKEEHLHCVDCGDCQYERCPMELPHCQFECELCPSCELICFYESDYEAC